MRYLPILLLLGCSSIRGYEAQGTVVYGSPIGDRTPIIPDKDWYYDGIDCSKQGVISAWRHMYTGDAGPHETLYYYRCRGPNEYQKLLKDIRSRRIRKPVIRPRRTK